MTKDYSKDLAEIAKIMFTEHYKARSFADISSIYIVTYNNQKMREQNYRMFMALDLETQSPIFHLSNVSGNLGMLGKTLNEAHIEAAKGNSPLKYSYCDTKMSGTPEQSIEKFISDKSHLSPAREFVLEQEVLAKIRHDFPIITVRQPEPEIQYGEGW